MARWRCICLQTLRARFLLALALIGILPLGLVGLGMATLNRQALAEQSAQELTGLARGLAGQLEVYLDDMFSATQAMAALPEIISMDPARQEPLLKEFFHHYPPLARLSTFDLFGSPLASSHPGGAPSIAAQQSFQTAVQRGHQAWEVAPALSSGRVSLVIHTPIRNAERRVVGVVGAVIDLVNLSAVVGRVPVGGGGRVFVLDADEHMLMHPEWAAIQERRDYSWMGIPTGGRPAGPATVQYQFAGEALVAGYAPVPNVDWTVVVERPQREILAPARQSWHLAVTGLGMSTGLALLTAVVLARMLTRPVQVLATAAQALAVGDAAVPLPAMASNVGELRILEEAFTVMREAVIQREEALRQSEERFRSLIEHSADAIASLDGKGTILYTTSASTRILGYSLDELIGRTTYELTHAEDLPATRDVFRRLLAQPGASITAEVRFQHKNGSWRWIEAIRTNWLAEPGVQAIVVNYRDITERKRIEVALRTSEARKRAMLEGALDAIISTTHTGEVLEFNPAAERIFGYSQAEALGQPIAELIIPPYLRQQHAAGRARYLATGESAVLGRRIEFTGMRADGTEFPVELTVVRIAQEGPPVFTAYIRDITDRKQAEEQLQRLLYEKEALLREIHHRVKNNLTVVSSLLDLQTDTIQDPEVQALLKDSQQRIRSMALIHEQLYRSDDLAWIDFAAYVRDLGTHVANAYRVNSDCITLTMTLEDVRLNLDTAMPCGLIVQELLSNCFKHAFPGDRAGEICITFHAAPQETYILSVSDTGVGLPEGLDFRQTTSLGLQLVCLLTEQLDGTITVDHQHGTTFTITFAPVTRSVKS